MALVGIDLGTTNSLVAYFTEDGAKLIPNSAGSFVTPSAVGFSDEGDIIVGQAAKYRLISHPSKTTARFKRSMGAAKTYKLGKKSFKAEDLSALILRSLKEDAERHLGETVDRAIISVPAYFNDIQRKATYAAGKMAGLKVERLINEPTAAALAYGLKTEEDDNTFLVVDLGGGTFDVSILEIFDGVMEVRSSAGDAFLGGEDFTQAIEEDFLKRIGDAAKSLSSGKKALLRDLANKTKEKLTSETDVTARFQSDKEEHNLTMSRERFEEITDTLVKRLRRPLQRAITDAGLRTTDIDRVILVGGATRMPVLRKMVTKLLKSFPEHSLDPDHVIALGTAVQAGLVERHSALEDVVMTDVCPFTLGTDVTHEIRKGQYEAGHFQPIIERNTVIPASRVVRNYTMQPGQEQVQISIYQGESPRVVDNVRLGSLNVWVPKNKTENEAFDIRFTYDVSGVLEVLVTVVSTEKTQKLILEGNPGSISQAEIEKRFKDLEKIKIHPRDKSENAEIIARLKAAYENHLGETRKLMEYWLTEFEQVLAGQNDTDIAQAREKLSAELDKFDQMDIF